MRFILEEVLLEKIHPYWPGGIFWKIKDTKLNIHRLGMYTSESAGLVFVNRLNSK